jgi:hypothetical protein
VDLKKQTIFPFGTSSDSISNEKSEELVGLEFNRIYSWNFKFGQDTYICT